MTHKMVRCYLLYGMGNESVLYIVIGSQPKIVIGSDKNLFLCTLLLYLLIPTTITKHLSLSQERFFQITSRLLVNLSHKKAKPQHFNNRLLVASKSISARCIHGAVSIQHHGAPPSITRNIIYKHNLCFRLHHLCFRPHLIHHNKIV